MNGLKTSFSIVSIEESSESRVSQVAADILPKLKIRTLVRIAVDYIKHLMGSDLRPR